MLQSITVAKTIICVLMLLIWLMNSFAVVECKALVASDSQQTDKLSHHNDRQNGNRQFLYLTDVGRETSAPNFIRLVAMRVIYGMAVNMGVEDRLEDLFNGAFVPPNADNDFFDFGDIVDDGSDYGGDDGPDFDEASFAGLFDDDIL